MIIVMDLLSSSKYVSQLGIFGAISIVFYIGLYNQSNVIVLRNSDVRIFT